MQSHKSWLIGVLVVILLASCSLSAFIAGATVGGLVGGRIGYTMAEARAPVVHVLPTIIPPTPPWEPPWPEPPGREMRLAAVVTWVEPDGPADGAGIRPGDLILAVDDQAISPDRDLADIIRNYEPGDRVRLLLWRNGHEESVRVRLGRRRTDDGVVAFLGLTYRLGPVLPSW